MTVRVEKRTEFSKESWWAKFNRSPPLVSQVSKAAEARKVPLGKIAQPVAAEPTDADFQKAAVWKIEFPRSLDLSANPILRINYVGDAARVSIGGKLVVDDFYNGRVFEM